MIGKLLKSNVSKKIKNLFCENANPEAHLDERVIFHLIDSQLQLPNAGENCGDSVILGTLRSLL